MKKINENDFYVMGLDFGTTNIKGALYTLDGREAAIESVEYKLNIISKDIIENDVISYWDNLKIIIKNLIIKIGGNSGKILAIGTSSQAETIVPVDVNGNPLRDAIVWVDNRSTKEAELIRNSFDTRALFELTGQPDVDVTWPATRILWMRNNESEIFNKTHKYLLLEDFLVYKLTGRYCGEASLYNSSYYYDIINFKYIDAMLEFLGISDSKLPVIFKPGSYIGNISERSSAETGLSKKTKLVVGAIDQICGAVGAANISEGIATETTGSAFAMIVTTNKPIMDYKSKIPCALHAIPGLYALMPFSVTGGMVLKWFKDNFCQNEEAVAIKNNKSVYEIMDKLAKNIPAGCEGLIMLPHICGAFFPEYNNRAKGVFFGISINHTKGHFIRSILESLAYMMRLDIEAIDKLGVEIKRIISIGGGAKSDLWSEIKSNICGVDLEIPEYTETALLGSAILALSAVGFYSNISEACKNLGKIKKIYKPDKGIEIYNQSFNKYKTLYQSVKGLF